MILTEVRTFAHPDFARGMVTSAFTHVCKRNAEAGGHIFGARMNIPAASAVHFHNPTPS